ncbi:Uncharacterized protein dnm_079270 [Desulfonema magnum]|uniref:Uncharacterized protein n=1 Tax=Desulfonema magnum TaxID=45655 RepID=A0A975BUG6_9BACT|nr:Uncharacterized protein dnm_079270 [Desulfonema magnum]
MHFGKFCRTRWDVTGRGLQPRPKRLFSGVGKYFGRGCKPRPADHGLIKTMSYDLSLMHMGLQPRPTKIFFVSYFNAIARPGLRGEWL